jgi:large repetitive protein
VLPTFTYLEPDGFRVEAAATGTLLQNNQVYRFEDDGIDVEAPGTTVRRNAATDNGDLGIEAVSGVIDGGGNTASGNGNPLQCTNVFCG